MKIAIGGTLQFLGEFALAQQHFEQGLSLYNAQQHGSLAFLYGYDPGVGCSARDAQAVWFLGYPEQGLRRSREALTVAQGLTHTQSMAIALTQTAFSHKLCKEEQLTQKRAEALIDFSNEQGLPLPLALGTMQLGWALAEQGQTDEGIARVRQGLVAFQATGARVGRSFQLALLIEACGKAKQYEEALAVLDEALAHVEKTREHFYEAELYRLKGELTLQQEARGWRLETSPPLPQASNLKPQVSRAVEREAEEYFLKAIEIARRQSAKSLELRAVMSLGRLWQQQGKKKEAHDLLVKIYSWFTEGFDTKDLQEAQVLLQELT